jgi:outer membrane protein TolC
MKIHGLWTFALLLATPLVFAQDSDLEDASLEDIEAITSSLKPQRRKENLNDQSKKLTLREAIEEGLRLNSLEQIRQFTKEKLKIEWSDTHSDFWFPQLSVTVSNQETLVDNVYGDLNDNSGTSKTPRGSVSFGFDNYTLFNWGRDYLEYLNFKDSYKRQQANLQVRRRELRFKIISQYFNVVRTKEITRSKRTQLRHSSFIYRLAKEKLSLKKIRSQQFYQAKAEFLKAHNEYQESLYNVTGAEQDLATSIGDELTTTYSPREQLKFKTLTTLKDTSFRFAVNKSPLFLDAKVKLTNANRSFEKALKDNMPLPKFDLKLGAFRHNFSDGGAEDVIETSTGNRNVEVVASINMKWKIFGSGGLFNTNRDQTAYLDKKIAEIEYRESKRNVRVSVSSLHRKIRFLEKQYEASAALLKNMKITFDKTLDNYISGKTSFANIKLTLELLMRSYEEYENSKYLHLVTKLELANLIGMDDFPGESFEGLVVK